MACGGTWKRGKPNPDRAVDSIGCAGGAKLSACMADEKRSRTLLWVLIGGGAFFLFVLAVFTLVYLAIHAGGDRASLGGFGDKIGVVELEGVILDPGTVVGST